MQQPLHNTLSLHFATVDDAMAVTELKNAAAIDLTNRFGQGHWSYNNTEKGVLVGMKENSQMLLAKYGNTIAGTLRLTTKKPWAIDPTYFTEVSKTIYLVDMAVHPSFQNKGVGKWLMEQAAMTAKNLRAKSIRLDAYDADAGAGDFYRKCGYSERGRIVYRGTALIYFEILL